MINIIPGQPGPFWSELSPQSSVLDASHTLSPEMQLPLEHKNSSAAHSSMEKKIKNCSFYIIFQDWLWKKE